MYLDAFGKPVLELQFEFAPRASTGFSILAGR